MIKKQMKTKHIIFFLFLASTIIAKPNNELKITDNKKKMLNQAYSLKKNGLIDEALKIYKNLFEKHPSSNEVYEPIKLILINTNKIDELSIFTEKYIEANNNRLNALVNVFDVYLILENETKMETILSKLISEFPNNQKLIKKVLKILLNKNKLEKVVITLDEIRKKENDFYSLELGMHYSLSMMVEKSLDEFFLYLNNNQNQKEFIFNRILAFPDLDLITNKTRKYLNESDNIHAILLLSKIEFKQKNYLTAYDLITLYQDNENYYIKFIEDLIKVQEFELAQKIIYDIFELNFSKQTMEQAIFLLAQIFEKILLNENNNLVLINDIKQNEILNSPFKKINDEKNMLLTKAITIYDSLSISTKQIKPLFHLAEINYKILADFDNADILYKQIISLGYNNYYRKSIQRIIDIMISKGNLEKALIFINENIDLTQKSDMKDLLEIKKIQILYYLNDFENLKSRVSDITKKDLKKHMYYNDILKISYDILLFSNDSNFEKYSLAMHKVYQNKRTEAISILESITNTDNELISNKIKFDCAYLYYLQGNIDKALGLLEGIESDSPFKEQATLFEAEIYDYTLSNKSKAAELYLSFLNDFELSIHYESVRFRLRELAG